MTNNFFLPTSDLIKGFEWLGERISYPEKEIKGDTYPLTWADDDEIYTSAGDPNWGETGSGLDVEKFSGGPEDYKIVKVHQMNDYLGWGGDGPKPSGMICVDGILYLAFQNMLRTRVPPSAWFPSTAAMLRSFTRQIKVVFGYPLGNIEKPMFPGHSLEDLRLSILGKITRTLGIHLCMLFRQTNGIMAATTPGPSSG
jgi:hypothetical protein